MGVIAGLVRIFVDALQVFDSVSNADSRLYAGARQAGDALVSSIQRYAAWQMKDFNKIGPAQRRFF